MSDLNLLFGLPNNSRAIGDSAVAEKYRDFTLSWSRYGYHGRILEATTVDDLLSRAIAEGFRYCFIQSYGHVISERWSPEEAGSRDFHSALAGWFREHEFVASGHLVGNADKWYGFRPTCLFVDLERSAHHRSKARGRRRCAFPRSLRTARARSSSLCLRREKAGAARPAYPAGSSSPLA